MHFKPLHCKSFWTHPIFGENGLTPAFLRKFSTFKVEITNYKYGPVSEKK